MIGAKNEPTINILNNGAGVNATKGGLSVSTRPRGETTLKEGGAKRLNTVKRDAGASTPATINTLSSWVGRINFEIMK